MTQRPLEGGGERVGVGAGGHWRLDELRLAPLAVGRDHQVARDRVRHLGAEVIANRRREAWRYSSDRANSISLAARVVSGRACFRHSVQFLNCVTSEGGILVLKFCGNFVAAGNAASHGREIVMCRRTFARHCKERRRQRA